MRTLHSSNAFPCNTGLDTSVPSIIFIKNSKLQHLFSAIALLSSGAMGQCYEHALITAHDGISQPYIRPLITVCIFAFKGCVNLWNVLSGAKCVGSFKAVRYYTQQHFSFSSSFFRIADYSVR